MLHTVGIKAVELVAEEVVYDRSFTRLESEAGQVLGRKVHWSHKSLWKCLELKPVGSWKSIRKRYNIFLPCLYSSSGRWALLGARAGTYTDPWSNYYSRSSVTKRKINTERDSRTIYVWVSFPTLHFVSILLSSEG